MTTLLLIKIVLISKALNKMLTYFSKTSLGFVMMFTTMVDLARGKPIFIRNFTFREYTVTASIIGLCHKGQDQISEITPKKY